MAGRLYIVSTPIGNLGDMTKRAEKVLGEVGCIAAEDTRHTEQLLHSLGIKNRLLSFHAHSEHSRVEELLALLESGADIALVTDAGTPVVSDPGTALTSRAAEQGIEIISVPGPCAAIAALSLSALTADKFIFEGFMPRDKTRVRVLEKALSHEYTTILYESPHHLLRTLAEIRQYCPDRGMALCKELTKVHEKVYRGTVETVTQALGETEPKGEYVIVLEGAPPLQKEAPDEEKIVRMLKACIEKGLSKKDAVNIAADVFETAKNRIYALSLSLQE